MNKEEVLNHALSMQFGGMSKNELSFLYDFCKDKEVLELGSMVGMSSFVIAHVCKAISCVDKWTDTFEILSARQAEVYTNDWLRDKPKNLSMLQVFKDNCAAFLESGKMKMEQGETDKVCGKFENGSFDIVLIDADHEYDGVKSDIENYVSKLKKDGVLVFHDYGCDTWFGVTQACQEMVRNNKMKLIERHERIAIFTLQEPLV